MPGDDARWFTGHIKTLVAVAVNLVILGMIYATMRDDIRHSQEAIEALKAQKSDELRYQVAVHEKRLDGHDAAFLRIDSKLEKILEGISARR